MGKTINRSRKIIIIITILFIITIILNVFIYIKHKDIKQNIITYNNILYEKEKELKELENEYNTLKEDIELLDNIDNKINDTKSKFFAKVKELEDKILSGESNEKIAYLTFDDGPYYLTYEFLNVLDEYDVLATFFTIGLNKDNCYDARGNDCSGIYAIEASKGHTMANHTYSHAIFKGLYNSTNSFIEQVKLQENLLMNRTGIKPNILRFPGGSGTAGNLKYGIIEELRKMGYGYVDWTCSIGDGGSLRDYNVGWNNFVNGIDSKIEVVLMHDYNRVTLSLLPAEIKYLRENGYHIFPLFYESNMIKK